MRKLLTFMLLTAAMLPALGQAQTVNICDRTPQVRDEILRQLKADNCAAVDSEGLASIHGALSLQERQLTTLQAGDFAGLTSLEYLYLSNNQLSALPDGAFDGLTRLEYLYLNNNQLSALPASVFDGLTRLEYLDLNNNQLSALPASVFDGLTSLYRLDLDNNQLSALPASVFDGLTSLYRLDLDNNQLSALPAGVFDGPTRLQRLNLYNNQLSALLAGVFDDLTRLEYLYLNNNQLSALPASVFDGLTRLERLYLDNNQLSALPDFVFDGLARLQRLYLFGNQLTGLPASVFDGLTRLERLYLDNNQLSALPDSVFDGLTRLGSLTLHSNQLSALPASVFDGLARLDYLYLDNNQLSALPAGVFDGLTSLDGLQLSNNQLSALPAGVFDGLAGLDHLYLNNNQLSALPDFVFDGLTSLSYLYLEHNQLTALPYGVFDGLTRLQRLYLDNNQLSALPDGAFDGLTSLLQLNLGGNHLVGLTRTDPLFAGISSGVNLRLGGQTEPGHLVAAVPFMLSVSDSMGQGFVRIINESNQSGSVRILAFDDGGTAASPIDIELGAMEAFHFNSNDLENGNANKGIEGVGSPVQGDWRLDIETALAVRVLSYVRTNDGFLTAMHDRLPDIAIDQTVMRNRLPNQGGLFGAMTFNPGSNTNQVSELRLVNAGANTEELIIYGIDDRGNKNNSVTLTLAAGESRTFSAQDLENGAQGLGGTLGDGAGKWRLFVLGGDWDSVVGMSLLRAASGHLTNISTMPYGNLLASVPLMLSASDSMGQGFLRILYLNNVGYDRTMRILAFDDGGTVASPIDIELGSEQALHFNSNDLENGNANKGINAGVGSPVQGDWRLELEKIIDSSWEYQREYVRVLSYVRTNDGFLTAMHDALPRDAEGRLAAYTFNPGSNTNQVSELRLVNAGANTEELRIIGVDDRGNAAGPVTLTLAAGESRAFSAQDLENGAQGLTGTLGDGAGKWRLFITARQPVVGMSLLRAASGHLTNLSTSGVAAKGR